MFLSLFRHENNMPHSQHHHIQHISLRHLLHPPILPLFSFIIVHNTHNIYFFSISGGNHHTIKEPKQPNKPQHTPLLIVIKKSLLSCLTCFLIYLIDNLERTFFSVLGARRILGWESNPPMYFLSARFFYYPYILLCLYISTQKQYFNDYGTYHPCQ